MADSDDDRPDLNPPPAGGKASVLPVFDEEEGEGYELEPAIVETVVTALDEDAHDVVREQIRGLHYADAADLLERLTSDQRLGIMDAIGEDFDPDVLTELDETIRDEILEHLGPVNAAQAIAELDTDDAVEVMREMDAADQEQIFDAIPEDDRTLIKASLSYPEDSAGRLMQRELMTVPLDWTVGNTIDFLRESAEGDEWELPEIFYDIFVVDSGHRPLGMIPLSLLLKHKREATVSGIMQTEMKLISVTADQEDVAFLFRQRDLVSAPVVDDEGHLVGAITIDDVVDVIDEEYEEDIMRLGGVKEGDLYHAALDTTRSRFSWLLVNLITAIAASVVIGLFEGSIDQMVALAVLMPIVASMGGNAGTQTLTVAVRALATKELTTTNAFRVIGKELIVGGFNGILFAVLTGLVAWVWFGDPLLGYVIAAAMVVNMVVAGLAGSSIPLFFERIGVDPAIASGVFLTTVTDVVGFAAFLGLAALFLL